MVFSVSSLCVIGRSKELAILDACVAAVAGGGRCAVRIVGDPGSGKTWLATCLAERAHQRGLLVAWCSLRAPSTTTPYELWIRLVEDLLLALERDRGCDDPDSLLFGTGGTALAQLAPHLGASRGAPEKPVPRAPRSAVTHELARAVARIANWKPLVLVFDDLQFADDTSLAMFREFCSSVRMQGNLLVCVTSRTRIDPSRSALIDAVGGIDVDLMARNLSLEPFRRNDVADYLSACGAMVTEELVESVYRATVGNPFFVSQLAMIDSHGCHDLTERLDTEFTATLEERIEKHFRLRLQELDETTRRLLYKASVLGDEFSVAELACVVGDGMSSSELAAAIRSATAHSYFDEIESASAAEPRYRFHHELVRTSVMRCADAGTLADAHHRVGVYLMPAHGCISPIETADLACGKRLARAGDHFLKSGHISLVRPGVEALLRASEMFLDGGAWEDAELLLSRLETSYVEALHPGERARIAHGLGRVLLFNARKSQAYPLLASSLEYFASVQDYQRVIDVALQPTAHEMGHTAYPLLLQRALSVLPADHPQRPRIVAYYAAALALVIGDYPEALGLLQREAAPELLDTINRTDALRAQAMRAYLCVRLSKITGAQRDLDQALTRYSDTLDPLAQSIILRTQYDLAVLDGDLGLARAVMRDRQTSTKRVGDRYMLAVTELTLGRKALREADWPLARDHFLEALRHHPGHALAMSNLAFLEFAVGRQDEGERITAELLERAVKTEPGPFTVFIAAAAALVSDAWFDHGAGGSRLAQLHEAHRMLLRVRGGTTEHPFVRVRRLITSAVVAYYLHRETEAKALLDALRNNAHYNTIESAHIHRATGLLWCLLGYRQRGESNLLQSFTELRNTCDMVRSAFIEFEYARELSVSDPEGALIRFKSLMIHCKEYGIHGLANRVQRCVRPADTTGGEEPIPRSDVRSLTSREREVVRLLADGLSDKAIASALGVSTHTASNHVRNILRKTRCTNRTQVVARLAAE